jgi:hypothetical protein
MKYLNVDKQLRLFNNIAIKKKRYSASAKTFNSYDEQYKLSINDPVKFWGDKIDTVSWYKRPTKIFEKNISPFEKW